CHRASARRPRTLCHTPSRTSPSSTRPGSWCTNQKDGGCTAGALLNAVTRAGSMNTSRARLPANAASAASTSARSIALASRARGRGTRGLGSGDAQVQAERLDAVGLLELVRGVFAPLSAVRQARVGTEDEIAHEVIRYDDAGVGRALGVLPEQAGERRERRPPGLRPAGLDRNHAFLDEARA